MKPSAEFLSFCRLLHQDIVHLHLSYTEIAHACLKGFSTQQRIALHAFLSDALSRSTDAELKGLLRRNVPDHFFSSRAARQLLEAAVEEVRN